MDETYRHAGGNLGDAPRTRLVRANHAAYFTITAYFTTMTDDTTTTQESNGENDDHGQDDREQGIDFGEVDDAIDAASYPLTLDELLADHGDAELAMGDETTTLREVLGPLGEDEYESAEEVRQAVFNMVDREAVGRQRYTDRGEASGSGADDGSTTNESL